MISKIWATAQWGIISGTLRQVQLCRAKSQTAFIVSRCDLQTKTEKICWELTHHPLLRGAIATFGIYAAGRQ